MTRRGDKVSRGYFGIGIERSKTEANVGTLWRSAFAMGASFIFTIGRRCAVYLLGPEDGSLSTTAGARPLLDVIPYRGIPSP